MPDVTLSEAHKEALALCTSTVVLVETVELSHPGVATPIRLCKALEDKNLALSLGGEVVLFTACPFALRAPASGETGAQELALAVSNTSRDISDFLNACLAVEAPVNVIYRIYHSNDSTQPQNGNGIRLFLYDVVMTATEVTGRATFAELINQRWPLPNEVYSKTRFPGLNT